VVALAEARETSAATLPLGERREWAALPPAARDDYLAGRLAARRALRHARGRGGAAGVTVRRRPGAPPAVRVREADRGGWRRASVALSLAHRNGRGAAVLAPPGSRVGVDLELQGAVRPWHLRYFTGEGERRSGPQDAAALWTLKEAAWKALQLGSDRPFRSLTLEFDGARRLCAVLVDGVRLDARASLARPWPGHLLAVVRVDA
jgi:phosphopantetheinyl transferase